MAKNPLRYQVSRPVLAGREKEYVIDALETGWISGGSYVTRFEHAVSTFLGLEEGSAVANGTVALHLACLAMGLGPGMEVIVPSLTYVASANAVAYCGAKPVFADCDSCTWNVTRQSVESEWTPQTAGVVLVHLYGLPAPAQEIASLCRERGAWMVEDCSESFGAQVNGHTVGSFGDAATLSFYGNKIISTGEGGMVFARNPSRRRLIQLLRGQGMDPDRRYWHTQIGYNYRMSNVTAAIGLGQIEMADYHLAERRRIARRYFKKLSFLQRQELARLPVEPVGYDHVFWLFGIVLESGGPEYRQRVQDRLLAEHGIETRRFFVPMHQLPMFSENERCRNADFLSDHGISLPTFSGLEDDAIDEIAAAVTDVVKQERQL